MNRGGRGRSCSAQSARRLLESPLEAGPRRAQASINSGSISFQSEGLIARRETRSTRPPSSCSSRSARVTKPRPIEESTSTRISISLCPEIRVARAYEPKSAMRFTGNSDCKVRFAAFNRARISSRCSPRKPQPFAVSVQSPVAGVDLLFSRVRTAYPGGSAAPHSQAIRKPTSLQE